MPRLCQQKSEYFAHKALCYFPERATIYTCLGSTKQLSSAKKIMASSIPQL